MGEQSVDSLPLDQILEWAIRVNSPFRSSEASFGVTVQSNVKKFYATALCYERPSVAEVGILHGRTYCTLDWILEQARAVIRVNSHLRSSDESFGVTTQTSAGFSSTAQQHFEFDYLTVCAAAEKINFLCVFRVL
ncbi:hypothetical protein Pmani_032267 [Petrolisthes manimaculis]|uniref:Uncharacterized protein n=1 Tax=Petrolisthes manimaculis TaxID=1843537 RepID=A0AAE1TRL6_9EUCA|nr:hypothetical protein Pmani_032267 [Petrolisthes manimaculis]